MDEKNLNFSDCRSPPNLPDSNRFSLLGDSGGKITKGIQIFRPKILRDKPHPSEKKGGVNLNIELAKVAIETLPTTVPTSG